MGCIAKKIDTFTECATLQKLSQGWTFSKKKLHFKINYFPTIDTATFVSALINALLVNIT